MRIAVKCKPGSTHEGISLENGTLVLRVRARAVEGAANEACIRALAAALDIAPSQVVLVRGGRSREKLFEIGGIEESIARKRLGIAVS